MSAYPPTTAGSSATHGSNGNGNGNGNSNNNSHGGANRYGTRNMPTTAAAALGASSTATAATGANSTSVPVSAVRGNTGVVSGAADSARSGATVVATSYTPMNAGSAVGGIHPASARLNTNANSNNNALAVPAVSAAPFTDAKSSGSTDSVIQELKALAKSMLEATNAARRRTSSIDHRNSYEALMHAIENRVHGDGTPAGKDGAADAEPAMAGLLSNPLPAATTANSRHADPNLGPNKAELTQPDALSAHVVEQLTDIPAELSPGSRVRQQQQLEQLQFQQQQQRSLNSNSGRAGKTRGAGGVPVAVAAAGKPEANVHSSASAATAASVAVAAIESARLNSQAAPSAAREAIPDDDVEEAASIAYRQHPKGSAAGGRHGPQPYAPQDDVEEAEEEEQEEEDGDDVLDGPAEEEEDDDDGTAYDGVKAQVLFKPVNRTAYHEVLASTWKPESLTRRVKAGPALTVADAKNARSASSRGSSSSEDPESSSAEADEENGDEEEKKGSSSSDGEAIGTVATRNKVRAASAAQAASTTHSMKVYRVPAFPYGGGVTEQQARVLQRQFDQCIQNGEHLSTNAAGPALITKKAFNSYAYPEVDMETAQMDAKSFKPTSPYEFVVEVEREVRFDAVKAREERRRRFKRLVQEHRAPATMGTFDLRVIMDPFKTGFEEEKNFPIVPGSVIAGRYEIIQMLGKATFSRAVRCYDLHDPIYEEEEEEQVESEDEAGSHAPETTGQDREAGASTDAKPTTSASPATAPAEGEEDKAGRPSDAATSTASSPPKPQQQLQKRKKQQPKKRKILGYGQVCLKIINNTKDFFDQALDEIRLLTLLNRQRDPDEAHIVRLIDAFYYKEHVMLVTELLRDTLYDYGKYNREEEEEFYFTIPRLRRLTRQIVEALAYVHSLNLIHTDLKPENIMFVSYSRCIVKVIDFGSSCFLSDHLSSYIQSRSYRAPEVVLGCDYDGRIDVWSLGAILVEMVTGDVLFTSDTVPEMLARIVYVCGSPFPRHMLWEGRHTSDYVNKFGCIYEYGGTADGQRDRGGAGSRHGGDDDDGEEPYCLYTPVPAMAPHTCVSSSSSKKSKAAPPAPRTPAGPFSVMREKLAAAQVTDPAFLSFVEACLTLDHKRRPTTAQLLHHPFIRDEVV